MAKLLVKEFVDCARALGDATTTNKERFGKFLKESGYESLNDYKARASEEKQAENFKLWTSQLGDNGSVEFLWATDSNDIVDDFGKNSRTPATQIKEAVGDSDMMDDEGFPIPTDEERKHGIGNEEVTIGDLADDVSLKPSDSEKLDRYDKLMDVLGGLNASKENKVYDDALVERVDECVVTTDQNVKVVNRMLKQLATHVADESLHRGGAVPSFKLEINEIGRAHV